MANRRMFQALIGLLVVPALAVSGSAGAADFNGLTLDTAELGHSAQPNIAVDAGRDRFVLTWQARLPDGCAALRAAELVPGDDHVGEVREIARGCDWFVNWADIPSLVVTDNGDWLAHWLQRREGGTYAYDIRLSRSRDRGRTWSEPFSPHSDGTPTQHGFVSMAPVSGGDGDRVLLVWLDGRAGVASAGTGEGHDHHDEGVMSLRSAIVDRAGAVHEDMEIDARVCSCCPTGLVRAADGSHLAVYRDRSAAEVRDTALARRDVGGWRVGVQVHDDGWVIQACPVNGPALAAREEQVLVAWSTMADGDGVSVRYRLMPVSAASASNTTPATFRELEKGSGVAGRVAVAASAEDWLIAWLGAGEDGNAVLRLARFDAALVEKARFDIATLPTGRDIGLPRLAVLGDHALLVWTAVDPEAPVVAGQRRVTRLQAMRLKLKAANRD